MMLRWSSRTPKSSSSLSSVSVVSSLGSGKSELLVWSYCCPCWWKQQTEKDQISSGKVKVIIFCPLFFIYSYKISVMSSHLSLQSFMHVILNNINLFVCIGISYWVFYRLLCKCRHIQYNTTVIVVVFSLWPDLVTRNNSTTCCTLMEFFLKKDSEQNKISLCANPNSKQRFFSPSFTNYLKYIWTCEALLLFPQNFQISS